MNEPAYSEDIQEQTPTTIVANLFVESLFSTGQIQLPQLHGEEEMLYHQIQANIEMQDKLAEHIPSPPAVLMELLNELKKEDTDFTRVKDIVAEDAGLIGEIIHVANSPLYLTRAGAITSLEKAIALQGINGVMKVATTVMMRNMMDLKNCPYTPQLKKLWSYCLQSAESCQMLGNSQDSFTNYLLGLVHQIGSVSVISLVVKLRDQINNGNLNDALVLQRVLMERSAWLSSLIAGEWNMPEEFLLTLNEYDQLVHGKLDAEDYEHCQPITRNLEAGCIAAQCYSLLKAGCLSDEEVTATLECFRIEEKLRDKLFTRLDLAEALVS